VERPALIFALSVSILLAACSTTPDKAPSIGVAWAGPEEIILHKDIDAKSPTTGAAHHGDRLDIIAQRRRWLQVRNERGMEGWVDDRQLLDTAQMNRLRALAKDAAGAPSQGLATTFDTLNVHTEPNRSAPSFLRVKPGDKFDIIEHRVIVKGPLSKRQLIPPKPKAPKVVKKKTKDTVPLPPPPPAPAPPADWLELSRGRAEHIEPESTVAPPRDDWTLIRTASGRTGWVLTNRVYLSIPDEVAQYAEGHRITSYFSIGKVLDDGEQKDIWLWTTAAALGRDYDFDGYRVFTWSIRHHRYETAFIQRRERGFFPVLAKRGEFSVCLEGDDGNRIRHKFVLTDTRVRAVGAEPCPASTDTEVPATETTGLEVPGQPAQTEATSGIGQRLAATVKGWIGRK
jgi:hypothetical protein